MDDKLFYLFLFAFMVAFIIQATVVKAILHGAPKYEGKIPLIKNKFLASPLGIKMYIVMSYFVVMLFVSHHFFPKHIRKVFAFFIGDFNSLLPYWYGLFFPSIWIDAAMEKSTLDGARKMVIVSCVFGVGICFFDWVLFYFFDWGTTGEYYNNPCLIYRLILSSFIPVGLIFYFRSKRMVEYFAKLD